MNLDEELLTIPEASLKHNLNLSIPRIHQLVRKNSIHVIEVNGVMRISRSEINRFNKLIRPPGRPRKVHIAEANPTIYDLDNVPEEHHAQFAQYTGSTTDNGNS